MTINVPDWAILGTWVYIKDIFKTRGDDPEQLYKERILGYTYSGFLHKAPYCPMYLSMFSDLGKTVFLSKDLGKQNDKYI